MTEDYEEPEFLAGLADNLDARPFLIVTRIGHAYTPRRFKKGVKRMCRHFGIPNSLTSLIAVSAMHDYELAMFKDCLFLFRVDSTFADIVTSEPAMLYATLELEDDKRIIQFI